MIIDSRLIDLTITLAIAFSLGLLFRKLTQPTITAYLITGILASMYTFSSLNFKLINNGQAIAIAYTIASLFLFLCLGIKFPLARIWRYANIVFVTTLIEVFFSVSAIYLVCLYLLGFSSIEAALMAASLVPCSISMTLRTIQEEKLSKQMFASIATGICLVENVMFAIVLSILGILISIHVDYISLSTQLSLVTLFTGLLLIGGSYAFPKIFEIIASVDENLAMLLTIALAFAIAYLGTYILITPITAILLMSVTLSTLKLREKLEENFKFLEEIVAGIFFLYAGFFMNIWNFSNFEPIILLYVILIVSKFLPAYTMLWLNGYGKEVASKVAISISVPGEISFLIANFAVLSYGLNQNILQYTLMLMLINFIAYPQIIRRIK
ncbi:MAG TPA: cation:proton antiporter [Geobacterales bacterium]|nr:cation:proton antiporter [Geobacterales bacterium]